MSTRNLLRETRALLEAADYRPSMALKQIGGKLWSDLKKDGLEVPSFRKEKPRAVGPGAGNATVRYELPEGYALILRITPEKTEWFLEDHRLRIVKRGEAPPSGDIRKVTDPIKKAILLNVPWGSAVDEARLDERRPPRKPKRKRAVPVSVKDKPTGLYSMIEIALIGSHKVKDTQSGQDHAVDEVREKISDIIQRALDKSFKESLDDFVRGVLPDADFVRMDPPQTQSTWELPENIVVAVDMQLTSAHWKDFVGPIEKLLKYYGGNRTNIKSALSYLSSRDFSEYIAEEIDDWLDRTRYSDRTAVMRVLKSAYKYDYDEDDFNSYSVEDWARRVQKNLGRHGRQGAGWPDIRFHRGRITDVGWDRVVEIDQYGVSVDARIEVTLDVYEDEDEDEE